MEPRAKNGNASAAAAKGQANASAARTSDQKELTLDFESMLPDWDGFPIWWLQKRWRVSGEHWNNLIEKGELKLCVDLRTPGASRSTLRVTRVSLLEFFHRRKNVHAVADSNPRPAYREASKRKPRSA